MLPMPEPPHRSCQGVNMPGKNVLSLTLAKGQSSRFMCVYSHVRSIRVCVCVDMFQSVGFSICVCVGVRFRMSQL